MICLQIVVEGADAPITPAADKILRDKKILVVPDVCASGGSVASSYIEWLKNVQHVTFGRLPSSVVLDWPCLLGNGF